jgi:hypothetical protein
MDIKRLQHLAGLEAKAKAKPVMEAADDDEDPDAKVAASDKRQQEFEKKNAGALTAAEKAAKAAKAKPKAEEKKEEAPAAKAEEKKEAKAKGRKPSERGGSCRAWLAENPGATRSAFIAHCVAQGMGKANANTLFYSLKKKSTTTEAWMIFHPMVGNFVLCENKYTKRYQWVGLSEEAGFDPLMFETEAQALHILNEFDAFGAKPGIAIQVIKDGELVGDDE